MQTHLNRFLESIEQQNRYSQNTISAYKNDLGQFYNFVIDSTPASTWADISAKDIDAYIQDLQIKSYASSTIARKIAAVKSFFADLQDQKVTTKNPTLKVESPRVQKRTPQPVSYTHLTLPTKA